MEFAGRIVAQAQLNFYSAAPGVASQLLHFAEHGLVGKLSLPPGDGPFPGMIALGGSGGGFSEIQCEYYASHGFACLSLAYFAAPELSTAIERIPVEYFEKAIEWLLGQPKVRPNRVMLIGGSRGGELVLLLGSLLPKVRAVVAIAPSAVCWGHGHNTSWTYRGKDIPFVSHMDAEPKWEVAHDGVLAQNYAVMFEKAMENKKSVQEAMIPVERINGPVLFIGGGDDRLWPATRMIELSMERMNARVHRDETLCFPLACHGLGVPGLPTTNISMIHPLIKTRMNLGGTPIENAKAQRQAHDATLRFLRENSGD